MLRHKKLAEMSTTLFAVYESACVETKLQLVILVVNVNSAN